MKIKLKKKKEKKEPKIAPRSSLQILLSEIVYQIVWLCDAPPDGQIN
jgi:hypothetical protein